MSPPAALIVLFDTLFGIDRHCAMLDRRFQRDGAGFRLDYGEESFLVSADLKQELQCEYRQHNRRFMLTFLGASLAGLGMAIGADQLTGRDTPVWLTLAFLLGLYLPAGAIFWRREKRTWNRIIAKMRASSTPVQTACPLPQAMI